MAPVRASWFLSYRLEDVEPFRVEIGYWYWDAEHELVMRGLLTPPSRAVLASGGTAKPDDTIIKVAAASESDTFGILSNAYLLDTAHTTSFEVTLDLSEPNRFSYDQKTYMHHARLGGTYCHQDRNTLTLISRIPGPGQTAGVETHLTSPVIGVKPDRQESDS